MSGGIQLLPDHIIDEPPSPLDKRRFLYEFVIFDDDDDDVVKYGRSNNPLRRRQEWVRQCKGQDQHWRYCWEVPFAAKFEKLIHEHFKCAGAWLGPSPCSCCPVTHREKFDLEQCGGMEAVIRVIEAYLHRLGWPVRRYEITMVEFWGLGWGEKEMEQENSVNAVSAYLRNKFSAIHCECSPSPHKFYAFCMSVTQDTVTKGGIIATDVTGLIDENGPEVVDSGTTPHGCLNREHKLAVGAPRATHAETPATPRSIVRALLAVAPSAFPPENIRDAYGGATDHTTDN
ncbi:hypothetical protein B0H17DRAFT_1203865 [Mycena rosella]|uniref:Bacteriophage T5 Orf172 DNA-binding domain-containing protein n=1 Tax=Mycena rosella TaxID=1033263 RepID=A0AAD7DB18_MYCRO|nr:hypothetical protein B0H17DRAFT_1203865 [Mycena rosella]